MNPETRQTLIGVVGMTAVQLMALWEGFNGRVTAVYFVSVVGVIAPQALDSLPFTGGGG